MLTKDTAVCIRTVNYSETSQIVTFFTRANGKVAAIAKGSKRAKSSFDGPIEIFSYGEIVFTDLTRDKLATLTEYQQQPSFAHLSSDLFTLNCASYAVELVNLLTDDYDPHPELYDAFLQLLKDTGQTNNQWQATISLLILFQLALLSQVGLQPVLNNCINCKNEFKENWPVAFFTCSGNGLLCRDCEANFHDRIKLTKKTVNCLADLKRIAVAEKETLSEIQAVLIHHFTETLGKRPKMAKYILQG